MGHTVGGTDGVADGMSLRHTAVGLRIGGSPGHLAAALNVARLGKHHWQPLPHPLDAFQHQQVGVIVLLGAQQVLGGMAEYIQTDHSRRTRRHPNGQHRVDDGEVGRHTGVHEAVLEVALGVQHHRAAGDLGTGPEVVGMAMKRMLRT